MRLLVRMTLGVFLVSFFATAQLRLNRRDGQELSFVGGKPFVLLAKDATLVALGTAHVSPCEFSFREDNAPAVGEDPVLLQLLYPRCFHPRHQHLSCSTRAASPERSLLTSTRPATSNFFHHLVALCPSSYPRTFFVLLSSLAAIQKTSLSPRYLKTRRKRAPEADHPLHAQ